MTSWLHKNRSIVFIFLAFMLAMCLHAWYYYPFLSDDALISLRYADRLVDGKGLTWTDGTPVEGYSNLLWVLLTALLHAMGMDLIVAARLLGLLFMALGAFSLALHWSAVRTTPGHLPLLAGLFFFSFSAPAAIWAIGGLEQPLVAGLIALSLVLTTRLIESEVPSVKATLGLSLTLGLACVTRPDGPLFSVAAALSIFAGRWLAKKTPLSLARLFVLMWFPLVFYGGQLLFRWYYYAELVPNTALVKIAPSLHHLQNGALYLLQGLWALFPFSLLAVIALAVLLKQPSSRPRALPLLAICLLWMPYVAFVGGDIFPGYRHILPLIVAFSFAILEGAALALTALRKAKRLYRRLAGVAVLVACLSFVFLQFADANNQAAMTERWEWDCEVLGRLLHDAFHEQQPLIAVTAAGCLPYWSELPSLDMLGLNDYYLPRNPPPDFGSGYLGHELGSGAYVFSRQPDILVFNVGTEAPAFRSAREMVEIAGFHERYIPIPVLGKVPYEYPAILWVNKESPKIGVQRADATIRIPGFLFRGQGVTAQLNQAGALIASLPPGASAALTVKTTPGAVWNAQVFPDQAGLLKVVLIALDDGLEIRLISIAQQSLEIERLVLNRK